MNSDSPSMRNFLRWSGRVTTSGRLLPDAPDELAASGTAHVVNLALDDHPEALPDEAARFDALGVGYTHIPVPFGAPTRAHVDALRAILDQVEGPVHIHCIMNWRVTAFMYLIDREVDETAARAKMLSVWDPLGSEDPAAAPWKALLSP